jgi:predicted ATPase
MAEQSPIVIELEDLHHADDVSLDLLNALVAQAPNLPLLLICLARPALLERRPNWGSGQPFHRRIVLAPLDRRSSRNLARELLQKVDELPKTLRDLLVERSEGNPLYMEELVKMLIEDRVILKQGAGAWRVEELRLAGLRVPPTLRGLLQARFDTLLAPEKLTLQRAAVIGRVFFDGALAALDGVDESHVADLPRVLQALVAQGFIERHETSAFAGNVEYSFAQAMLRDLIAETLVSRQRQIYHRAMADWLAAGERAAEYGPLIAEHYEQAGEATRSTQYIEAKS